MNFSPVSPIPWLFDTLWNSQDAQGPFAYEATVYKASFCPCGNTPNSPNNINCAACGGYGILYPVPPEQIPVLISDVNQNLNLLQYGLAEDGDMIVSPQPGTIHFDNFDLLILPWSIGVPTFSQVLSRGSGPTDTAYYRILNVTAAWTVDPVKGTAQKYLPGTDFTYEGKEITWLDTGNAPNEGQLYSIRYDAQFEWVAYNPPQPRVAFGQDLGQKAVFRKRHILLPNAPLLLQG
ncbi:MAG: hypothetical protein K6T83_03170 [Alicyclobacillus sp.]|nr:hypothetical protein [Alicyclobacillus sp.]